MIGYTAMSSVKILLLLQWQRIGGQSYACSTFSGMWVNFMVHQAHLRVKQRANQFDKVSLLFCISVAALERDAWRNTNCCMFSALWIKAMKYNWLTFANFGWTIHVNTALSYQRAGSEKEEHGNGRRETGKERQQSKQSKQDINIYK